MICISINQESRRLALVDMLNASRQCDLLEIRLDRFGMAPGLSEMLAAKPKPAIMSCSGVAALPNTTAMMPARVRATA